MEGNKAIINKIIEDAEKKASSVIDKANFEGNLLINDAKKWAEDYIMAQSDLLKKQQDEIVARRKTVADLDVRKLKLQKKQDLINQILDKIYFEMTKLSKKDYLTFVERNIIESADKNDILILSKDNVLSKDDVVELKIVKDKNIKISDKKGNFIGGVYLEGEISDKDLTFKTIIDKQKEELISKIAEKLFD